MDATVRVRGTPSQINPLRLTEASYTHAEATSVLSNFLNDSTRFRIPNSHYEYIADSLAANGHSRESWEHLWSLPRLLIAQCTWITDSAVESWMILELGSFLGSVERIMEVAGLKEAPMVVRVDSEEDGVVRDLVCVDETLMNKIHRWIADRMAIDWDAARPLLRKAEQTALITQDPRALKASAVSQATQAAQVVQANPAEEELERQIREREEAEAKREKLVVEFLVRRAAEQVAQNDENIRHWLENLHLPGKSSTQSAFGEQEQ
jgi:hypothetical protein